MRDVTKNIPTIKRSMALGRLEFRPGKRFAAIDLGKTNSTNESIENWFRYLIYFYTIIKQFFLFKKLFFFNKNYTF